MTKKEATEPPELIFMFEMILGKCCISFQDSRNWRRWDRLGWHISWAAPLIELGAIRETKCEQAEDNSYSIYEFEVTEAGMQWWASQYSSHKENLGRLIEDCAYPVLEGKGIGAVLTYDCHRPYPPLGQIAIAAIEDGLLEFVSFYYYPWGGEKNVTVRLTRKGMEYFDSLPRLLLECA